MIYQIKSKRPAYSMCAAHVEVREKSNGEITIEYKQRQLEYTIYREQEQQQGRVIERKPVPIIPEDFRLYRELNAARERRGELCILRK